MKPINIAIVDDHQIIVEGLVAFLSKYEHIKMVASANNGIDMLALLGNQPIDILLTDVMMPGMTGIELAKEVRRLHPQVKIIALSMTGEAQTVNSMIENSDIAGYLLKQTNAAEMAMAIEKVYAGGIYFQESILKDLEQLDAQKKMVSNVHITNREKQLIGLIEKNYSNKEIAAAFNISLLTVETHRKNILRKTGASNVLSLVKWAYENNIL